MEFASGIIMSPIEIYYVKVANLEQQSSEFYQILQPS
jgi:hypothetical protein